MLSTGWWGDLNNPGYKVDMIAQRIRNIPSLISVGALEFQCPNILNECQFHC